MIEKVFNTVIAMKNIDHFSVVEIRTTIIGIEKNEHLVPADIRRFVYQKLVKLVAIGWLTKRTSDKKRLTRYSKTDVFDYDYFKNSVEELKEVTMVSSDQKNYHYELKSRLSAYNAELLEGLGAIKEYVSLKEIYPDLQPLLKQKYFSTQERNQILKGKISVLTELLGIQKENTNV
jgi:hypothetical protein